MSYTLELIRRSTELRSTGDRSDDVRARLERIEQALVRIADAVERIEQALVRIADAVERIASESQRRDATTQSASEEQNPWWPGGWRTPEDDEP